MVSQLYTIGPVPVFYETVALSPVEILCIMAIPDVGLLSISPCCATYDQNPFQRYVAYSASLDFAHSRGRDSHNHHMVQDLHQCTARVHSPHIKPIVRGDTV